jgi:subtilisin family serine protease
MTVRRLHYVTATALAALLFLTTGGQAQNPLSQKAAEAAEITAAAQQYGYVRVIVMFPPPVPANQLKPDATGVANAKARVAAAQDGILATHFGSAANPTPGAGFDRGVTRFPITPGFAINVTLQELQALAADGRVTRINYDRPQRHQLTESVPLIGMTAAYTLNATGAGQAVAVLDTGVKSTHEFLTGKVVAEACFSNGFPAANRVSLCPNGTQSQTGAGAANADTAACISGSTNLCQHGSHVAGIAAGFNTSQQAGEPPNGVAKDAKIFAVQIFTRFNLAAECSPTPAPCLGAWVSDQVLALDHVFANINLGGGTVVASVNMSLGGGLFSGNCDGSSQKTGIDNLRGAGVLTAVASGNDSSTSQISSPACISTAVAVGSTTETDAVSFFSNMSSVVDLLAPGGGAPPGTNILSSIPIVPSSNTTTYANFQGTSMATPHVAGAIAAIRSACPNATADAVENALKTTGTPVTDTRSGGTQTKPRIRVDLAVQSLNCNAPANDNFANAIAISGGVTVAGTNVNATKETGEPSHAGNAGGKSVWWSFTPSASGQITVNTAGSSFDTLLGVYTGSAVNVLTLVASNNDVGGGDLTSAVSFAGVSGTTYYIAVDGLNGASGSVTLFADQVAPAGPVSCTFPSRLGDINGDGKADLVMRRTSDGLLTGYLMNGTQVESAAVLGTIDPAFALIAVADFNADNKTDLLFRRADGMMALALMNGLQVTSFQLLGGIGTEWKVIGVGDFNGDGRTDFMTRRTADGLLAIYLMNGTQVVDAQIIGAIGTEWSIMGIADFNGDGRADFITHRADGLMAVYLMNGFQLLSAAIIGTVDPQWSVIAVGDFNGDGKADFLTRKADGTLAEFQMNGTAISASQVIGTIGAEWTFMGTGDLNGDGKSDMLFRRLSDGMIAGYLMNGFQVMSGQLVGPVGNDLSNCYGQGSALAQN